MSPHPTIVESALSDATVAESGEELHYAQDPSTHASSAWIFHKSDASIPHFNIKDGAIRRGIATDDGTGEEMFRFLQGRGTSIKDIHSQAIRAFTEAPVDNHGVEAKKKDEAESNEESEASTPAV